MKRWISMSARVGLLFSLLLGMLGVASATWYPASRISATMANDRDVTNYKISPDSTTVLYTANIQAANQKGLFTAPINGGLGVQVVLPPVDGGYMYQYEWTPNSGKVVYMGEMEAVGTAHIYSITSTGSNKQMIDDNVIPEPLAYFEMVSDTHIIAYTAESVGDGFSFEMYSIRIDGAGSPIKLNKVLPVGGSVVQSKATADGQWVVYRADANTDENFQLFSVRIDGTDHQVLSGVNISGGDVQNFTLSSDSQRVVWTGDLILDERVDLYSRPIDASQILALLDTTGDDVERPVVSPDSQWVAYVTDNSVQGELLRFTPIDSNQSEQASKYFSNKTNVFSFAFSPDSHYLVFIYDTGTVGKRFVEVDAILENTPAKTLSGSTDILDFEITPDSRSVVMRSNDKNELMITPIDSVGTVTLTDLTAGRSVDQYEIIAQGDYVIYRADRNFDDTVELFAVPARFGANIAAETMKLNSIFNTTNDVTSFELSDHGGVVYLADSTAADDKFELYSRVNQHQVFLPLVVR